MKITAVNVCFILATLFAAGADEFTAASEGNKPASIRPTTTLSPR